MKKSLSVLALVQLIACLLFLVGLLTVFAPCAPKEDGGFMTCHWAGNAAAGLAAVLCVMSVIRLAARDRRLRMGLDLAVIPTALLAALTPGRLIGLCMMADMRCHRLMVPGVTVCAVLIVLAALLDAWARRERHGL